MWNIIKYFVAIYCKIRNWYYGIKPKKIVKLVEPVKSDDRVDSLRYTMSMYGISMEQAQTRLDIAKSLGEPVSLIPIIKEFLDTGECETCGIKLRPKDEVICFGCKENKVSPYNYESVNLIINNPRTIIKHRDDEDGNKNE